MPRSKLDNCLEALGPRALGLSFLMLYLCMTFPAMPTVGDAADYAASIRHSDFGTRTVHIGYNIFSYPVVQLGTQLGLSTTVI